MAYWMAYKNRKGNYKNYMCSECHRAAPQDSRNRSIVSNKCFECGESMSFVGLLPGVDVVRV